jgi:glutamate 5-kinase
MTLAYSKRLVVKIGSALLIDDASNAIRYNWMRALSDDIAEIRNRGTEIVIVSSGAIGAGRSILNLGRKPLKLEEKQAAAATGQIRLAHAWQETLAKHDIPLAQILLTPSDTEERRRHLNARTTIETLLDLKAVPLINENDTVATEEIRFGDNDRLAARVAQMITADTLVLLSDIDGLYTSNPRKDPNAVFVPEVTELTAEIVGMADAAAPGNSSGGMVTKIAAADIAMRAGCQVIITDGRPEHSLCNFQNQGRYTRFVPAESSANARKRWIAGAVNQGGKFIVDEGAALALGQGGSLLPVGVKSIDGIFDRGDTVTIYNLAGARLGCGISAYCSEDAKLIAGRNSGEIEGLLGYRGRAEMIHRDNLVLEI